MFCGKNIETLPVFFVYMIPANAVFVFAFAFLPKKVTFILTFSLFK